MVTLSGLFRNENLPRLMSKNSTRISQHINAPRARVYSALVDANVIAKWKVPDGMTGHVHEFDAREGGSIRISLTYDEPTGIGKTTAHTDTYQGHFVKHEGLPSGVSTADNDTGWRMALAKLAALVEAGKEK